MVEEKAARRLPRSRSGLPRALDPRVDGMRARVLDRARSLSEARGKSLLAEALSLLKGAKEVNLDGVLNVAPGRTYEDQLAWSLAMASVLAKEDWDSRCDCSEELSRIQAVRAAIYQLLAELQQAEVLAAQDEALAAAAASDEEDARNAYQLAAEIATALCTGFGVLNPACYVAMIYEAIKGNDWSSAYNAMRGDEATAEVDQMGVGVLQAKLALEQRQEWSLENDLMACLIKCAKSNIKPSDMASQMTSKSRAKTTLAGSGRVSPKGVRLARKGS